MAHRTLTTGKVDAAVTVALHSIHATPHTAIAPTKRPSSDPTTTHSVQRA